MVKEKPRQYKAELESFKSFTHRVRDLVQYKYEKDNAGFRYAAGSDQDVSAGQ